MSTIKSRVKYTKLLDKEENKSLPTPSKQKKKKSDDDFHDEQFEDSTPIRVPIKSIIIAIILFVLGTVMLTCGSLMLAGVIRQGGGSFSSAPLMVIGSIIFIPGVYNVRTAYYAWKGYPGFSFSDIAGFGEGE